MTYHILLYTRIHIGMCSNHELRYTSMAQCTLIRGYSLYHIRIYYIHALIKYS